MLQLKQETCGDLKVALRREWLETNGLGGFASRRYGFARDEPYSVTTVIVEQTLCVSLQQRTGRQQGRRFSNRHEPS